MGVMTEMTLIFRKVFDDNEIVIRDDTIANDIDGWDSLSHINLVLAIEKKFNIKFSMQEFLDFNNVGDLRKSIENKIGK